MSQSDESDLLCFNKPVTVSSIRLHSTRSRERHTKYNLGAV